MTLQLDVLDYTNALAVERSEPAPEADHVLHPALRIGWLWRTNDNGSWQFTSRIAQRNYPPGAEFIEVYVPMVNT